ncbi:MAG: histidinol dehydrogenase [Lentisphaerae bacterium]|nr:histidinol dehydrogenase [Lentisphaerota bacterium]
MSAKMVKWAGVGRNRTIEVFFQRPAFDVKAEKVAAQVLREIRRCGDAAVVRFVKKFDGVSLSASNLAVDKTILALARRKISKNFVLAIKEAHRRIALFAEAGLRKDWQIATPGGGAVGEKFVPMDRVGVYIPGGTAPLVSTALMTVTLAKTAGVKEIVACSPCTDGNQINNHLLYALDLAGATEVYRIGGIQAIGAMAYGTRSVRRVQKIVGPGGAFVTAAKRQVYGDVALDLVAGPSEIAVLADDGAKPEYIAADLLSQAEHGTGLEKSLLVTSSEKLAYAVRREIDKQAQLLQRADAVNKVIADGMLLVVVRNVSDGMALCNAFAPEHLELMVRHARKWVDKVRKAGAVFVGPWSPESVGDFVAGPSHVLPTGGAAAMFSGLTVDDFRRRTSVIACTKDDLKSVAPIIDAFGLMEGLDGHAKSALMRFSQS